MLLIIGMVKYCKNKKNYINKRYLKLDGKKIWSKSISKLNKKGRNICGNSDSDPILSQYLY